MTSKLSKKIIEYQIGYSRKPMKKWRSVSIYPKILEEKNRFTPEEKKHLTRKGFYWYIRWDYWSEEDQKFERQPPYKDKVNRKFPDFDDRLREIRLMKEVVIHALENGLSPYGDLKGTSEYSLIDALEYALDVKKNEVGKRTYEDYEKTVNAFKQWLKDKGYAMYPVEKATKSLLSKFLNHVSSTRSNRTRNNYRTELSAIFKVLVNDEYLRDNPVQKTAKLKTAEKRDPTYSDKQVKDITDYLKENDRVMLMYIYFVSYLFWRPKENCRLKVKDINLEERLVTAPTKTQGTKTKLIPEILINDLREYLKDSNPEDYVFTPEGPGTWDRDLDGRRSYFTLKYRRIKTKMGVDKEYTIYSFRHSYVTRVYRNLLKEHTKDKALEILASITGHTSKAIQAYIHYTDANLPSDYSEYLKA